MVKSSEAGQPHLLAESSIIRWLNFFHLQCKASLQYSATLQAESCCTLPGKPVTVTLLKSNYNKCCSMLQQSLRQIPIVARHMSIATRHMSIATRQKPTRSNHT